MRISDWSSDVCASDLHRIRRRPAPLAQDRRIETAGKPYDIMDGQEVAGIVLQPDQPELLCDHRRQRLGQAIGMAAMGLAHHQMLEPPLRRPTCGYRLVRKFVTQLPKRSEDRREGEECVRTVSSRGWPYH